MKKLTEGTLVTRLTQFLFHYRTTPNATTGQSPAELMLGRQFRTCVDLLKPDVGKKVQAHQEQQKRAHDAHSKPCELQPGAKMYARNFGQGPPWLPAVVQESKGPVSYTVELEDDCVFCRHVDHLRDHTAMTAPPVEVDEYLPVEIAPQSPELPPADPPPVPAGQSLYHSTCPHKSPDCFAAEPCWV